MAILICGGAGYISFETQKKPAENNTEKCERHSLSPKCQENRSE